MEARKMTSVEVDRLASLINDEDCWDRQPAYGVQTELKNDNLLDFFCEVTDDLITIPEFTEEEVWGRYLDGTASICQADFIEGTLNNKLPELFIVKTEVYGELLILPEGCGYARYAVRIVD